MSHPVLRTKPNAYARKRSPLRPSHASPTSAALRSSAPHPEPLDAFPVTRYLSQAQNRVKPSPGPPFGRSPASSPACAAAPSARSALSHSIKIQRPRSDLTRVNPLMFFQRPPPFLGNQLVVHISSKIFTNQPFFFCFSPCAFTKLNPLSRSCSFVG